MDPKETTLYTAVVISAVVIGIIISYFVISIVRQQRKNMELLRQNMLAEITTMERERTRIATDLHDDLGPLLSAIKFNIDTVDAVNKEDREQLEKASNQIDELVCHLRQIATDLMPTALLRKGLISAIEEFIDNVREISPLAISFHCIYMPSISQAVSINLYRIIQEVTQNTIKHAQASKLKIVINYKKPVLSVHCTDNGKGFNWTHTIKETSGMGLRSLKSRAEILGGTLQAVSQAGKGTSYLFIIPINN